MTRVRKLETGTEKLSAKRTKRAENDHGKGSKSEENPRTFKPCCSPSSLVAAISKLNEMQKKAVEDIGFGGLLSISITTIPRDLFGWLLKRFRPLTRIVECNKRGLRYELGWADVRDAFLLPHNPNQPVLVQNRHSCLDLTQIRARWEREYGISSTDRVNVSYLLDKMLQLEDGGDDFKRMFVLYALSLFLVPSTNRNVRFSVLKSLLKVEDIKNLDWCEYVIEDLCESVRSWKEKGTEHVGGCLLFLQISYLHRHSWRGKSIPRSLPLIRHWNNQNMKDRMDEEWNSGGYGLGVFKPDEFPISKEVELEEEAQGTITFKLHRLFDDDATLEHKYPQEFDRAVAKMSRDLAVVCDLRYKELESTMDQTLLYNLSTSKGVASVLVRDIDSAIIKMQNVRYLLDAPEASDPALKSGDSNEDDDDNGYDDNQVSLEGGMVTDTALNMEEDGSDRDKAAAGDQGASEKSGEKTDSIEIIDLCDSDIDDNEGAASELNKDDENDDLEALAVEYGADNMISSEPKHELNILKAKRQDELNILKAKEQDVFVTKLLHTYPFNMKRYVQNYEAQIADFCISKSNSFHPKSPMFHDGRFTSANAEHFTTLELQEDISPFIINCWARLLNAARFDPSTPSKLCLRTFSAFDDLGVPTAILCKYWDYFLEGCSINVLNADLIFIPVHMNAHFFLLVVNFKNRLVQYLDNLRHGIAKEFEDVVEGVKNAISSFLEHHHHPEAEAVKKYEVKAIEGKWRNAQRDHDSGIYAMYHMETFTGKSEVADESLVMKANNRNVLRAIYCARLILSPVNTCTQSVLSGVNSFNGDKSGGKITGWKSTL